MEFFRHCPGCGRRFHIKLENKKMIRLDREKMPAEESHTTLSQFRGIPVTLLREEVRPIIVDVEEFQYNYKCKHCGHQWSENRIKEEPET